LRGPHRDDLQLYLDGRPAKIFASQGQQRTVALALKLAEIAFVRQYREESPLVLLDDVFSELDPGRGEQLLNFLRHSSAQLFISTTHPLGFLAHLAGEVGIFRVEAGQVYQWEG
ncbi:MAG: DNA replication and repair protein RecF, partial [Heliobacteriaceae bacterium]|nr:DNA replication and repair protein RecF [Heliobacteriaceae bacterium]